MAKQNANGQEETSEVNQTEFPNTPAIGEVPLDASAENASVETKQEDALGKAPDSNAEDLEAKKNASDVAQEKEIAKAIYDETEAPKLDHKQHYDVEVIEKFGSYKVGDVVNTGGGVAKVLIKKNLVKLK